MFQIDKETVEGRIFGQLYDLRVCDESYTKGLERLGESYPGSRLLHDKGMYAYLAELPGGSPCLQGVLASEHLHWIVVCAVLTLKVWSRTELDSAGWIPLLYLDGLSCAIAFDQFSETTSRLGDHSPNTGCGPRQSIMTSRRLYWKPISYRATDTGVPQKTLVPSICKLVC